tara:strand:+ start:683 stop:1051 length:369 start_codon:yes stop_codon:yes gene_type:complete
MKKTLLPFLTIFLIYGCGYSSQSECQVKEMQECNSQWCEVEAQAYCANLFSEKDDRKDNFIDFLKIFAWGAFAVFTLGCILVLYGALFKKEDLSLGEAFACICVIGLFVFLTYKAFFVWGTF